MSYYDNLTELEKAERKQKAEEWIAYIERNMPTRPAQTSRDHEDWAKYYLGLITDERYCVARSRALVFGVGYGRLMSDEQLIQKARTHSEAAKLLHALEEMHQ
jgi:hypothetical protein